MLGMRRFCLRSGPGAWAAVSGVTLHAPTSSLIHHMLIRDTQKTVFDNRQRLPALRSIPDFGPIYLLYARTTEATASIPEISGYYPGRQKNKE